MITPENHIEDISLIGYINFSDSIYEQEVGGNKRYKPKGIGECKIEVYGPNEGSVPHFHIQSLDKSFQCCVCIYSNNYFSHGSYTGKLNTKQCKELNEWLNLIQKNSFGKLTNWETIVVMWEGSNPECKFPKGRKVKIQPHYENMVNYKDQ